MIPPEVAVALTVKLGIRQNQHRVKRTPIALAILMAEPVPPRVSPPTPCCQSNPKSSNETLCGAGEVAKLTIAVLAAAVICCCQIDAFRPEPR